MRQLLRAATTLAAATLLTTTSSAFAAAPDSRPPTTPLTAGTPISIATTPQSGVGYRCSTGIPVRKDGREYLLTAQHCVTSLGEPIYSAWRDGKRTTLGTVAGISKHLDVAAIRVSNAAPRYWRGETARRAQIASLRIGSKACQHGVRSDTRCGITVTRIQRDKSGTPTRVIGRVTHGTAALPGDSGGTVVDTQGRIVGVISATSKDRRWMAWTPATTALDTWDMTIAAR